MVDIDKRRWVMEQSYRSVDGYAWSRTWMGAIVFKDRQRQWGTGYKELTLYWIRLDLVIQCLLLHWLSAEPKASVDWEAWLWYSVFLSQSLQILEWWRHIGCKQQVTCDRWINPWEEQRNVLLISAWDPPQCHISADQKGSSPAFWLLSDHCLSDMTVRSIYCASDIYLVLYLDLALCTSHYQLLYHPPLLPQSKVW